jgi:hypothetical protein
MKRLMLFLAGVLGSAGCGLPSFPIQTIAKPPAAIFAEPGKCRVRVDPLVFDAGTLWDGQPEGTFVAGLRPQAQQSHEADKPATMEMYAQQIQVNARDYLKVTGSVTTNPADDAALVVRSRVLSVAARTGMVDVQHELFVLPSGQKVGEFRVTAEGLGYGLGWKLRAAAAGQAWTVLRYFADRFACNGPPRVTDG